MGDDPNLALSRERIGVVLKDRWTLEEVIGVGGMAAVYAARHRNGARAAIKLLHGPLSEDAVVRERFLREAYLANSVEHPGTVQVLDDDADPRLGPFLVMELLEGSSVLELLDRGVAFDIGGALDIADQALDVLAAAHDKGIVHRDLKPANLFVCRDGVVKVLDFGIARVLESGAARLTRTGVPLGTPAYMAPEQARGLGREADGRADVYALGATLFRILSGRHVHVGRGAEQIAKVATMRAPSLREAAPAAPPMVCAVVDRSLEFELERRYGSAREMQTDVRALQVGDVPPIASVPLAAPGAVPALPPLQPRPRKPSGAASRPASGPESKATQPPPSEPRDAVTALAESLRQRARDEARRPDAFRPTPLPPVPAGDEDDEDMPTMVAAPSEMPVGSRPQAWKPAPPPTPRPKAPPKQAPPAPRRAPTPTPQAGVQAAELPGAGPADQGRFEATPAELRGNMKGLAAAQAFARVPNVPVPKPPPSSPVVVLEPVQPAPGGYAPHRPMEAMMPPPSVIPTSPQRVVPPTAVHVAGWNAGPTVPAAPPPPQDATLAVARQRRNIALIIVAIVIAAVSIGLVLAR